MGQIAAAKTKYQTCEIVRVNRSKLKFMPGNAQAMTKHEMARLVKSIQDGEVGLVDTPVWNKRTGHVVGGHHRIMAIDSIEGHENYDIDVAAIDADEPTERAINVMLNNPRNRGTYDPAKLAEFLKGIPDSHAHQTGFSDEDRSWLLSNTVERKAKTTRIDDAIWGSLAEVKAPEVAEAEDVKTPELEDIVYTHPGDVWTLGNHRLICGDSTVKADVDKVLDGEIPFMMVTDPPYGVKYDPEWRERTNRPDIDPHRSASLGKVKNDNKASWKRAWDLFPGTVAYVWHGMLTSSDVARDLIASRFKVRAEIVWAKTALVVGRGAYHSQHESCWYSARGKAKWAGDRKQSTIWQIQNTHKTQGNADDGKTFHSTQKPVECMARPIRNHGDETDHVYDPFLGSGTTIIACEQLGRRCFGVEIAPEYCDMIVRRWEGFTGEKAVRHDGETLESLETAGAGRVIAKNRETEN